MFLNMSKTDDRLSLHDCTAKKLQVKPKKLVFEFPDGIYHAGKVTGAARVTMRIQPLDDMVCYVYKVKPTKTIRKQWTMEKLSKKLAYGGCELEFVECYTRSFGDISYRIYLCTLHRQDKPCLVECELRLTLRGIKYEW